MKRKRKVLYIFLFISFPLLIFVIFLYAIKESDLIPKTSIKEKLESLSYLTWVPADDSINKTGVIRYDKKKSFEGINMYISKNLPTIHLMDMLGNVVHTWLPRKDRDDLWQHAVLNGNGDLLALVEDVMLVKSGWDSHVKWMKKKRFHHEIVESEDGDIYSIYRGERVIVRYGLPIPMLDDYIIVLSPDGKTKREISLYKVLKEEIPVERFVNIYSWIVRAENIEEMMDYGRKYQYLFKSMTPLDIFHTNSIQIMDRNINGFCKEGDLLISVRELDLIGIIDIEKEELIWKWGPGELDRQHYPTLLENGNILIFDNGRYRKYSRVIELDPIKKEVVWEYKANPAEKFFSKARGACQRLPNGNTLITESSKGHVFEVTEDGEIVWEFYNPQLKKDEARRGGIYRFTRITDPDNYPCLKKL